MFGQFLQFLIADGQEFVERRIEQADRDRQPRHDAEQFNKIDALHGQYPLERRTATFFVLGHDHLAHGNDALFFEEHVLGAT